MRIFRRSFSYVESSCNNNGNITTIITTHFVELSINGDNMGPSNTMYAKREGDFVFICIWRRREVVAK